MATDNVVDVEARTYSTLSSAVRLRASVSRHRKARSEAQDAVELLGKTTTQLGGLLSRLGRLDFNLIEDQHQLANLKNNLAELYQLLGSALSGIRGCLDSARKEHGPQSTEEYEPYISTLTRDHERLESILAEIEMHFSHDFRRALNLAAHRTGPPEERFMDWRTALGSLSD